MKKKTIGSARSVNIISSLKLSIGNDLRLQCDGGVERGAPGDGEGTPEMRGGRVFEQTVDRGDVPPNLGMIFLGIAEEQG